MHAPDKNASDQPLPGSVSDQNAEEAEPGHDDTAAGHGSNAPSKRDGSETGSGSGGESGEGSQSTGNPNSAG